MGLRGQLVLDGDCLRLEHQGRLSPLIVWPPGFSPYLENGMLEVRNGGGKAVARVGDFLTISGGGGPPRDRVNDPRCQGGPFYAEEIRNVDK